MCKTSVFLVAFMAMGLMFAPQADGLITELFGGLLQLVQGIQANTKLVSDNTFKSSRHTLTGLNDLLKNLLLTLQTNPMFHETGIRMDESVRRALSNLKMVYTSSITGIQGIVNQMMGRASLMQSMQDGIENSMNTALMDLTIYSEKCMTGNQVMAITNDILVCGQSCLSIMDGEMSQAQDIIVEVLRLLDTLFKRRSACMMMHAQRAVKCFEEVMRDMPIVLETIEMTLIPQSNVNALMESPMRCSTKISSAISTMCK